MDCQVAPSLPLGIGNPCSCCCTTFGCGWNGNVYKPFPLTLPFILSLAGSCTNGTQHVISGDLTYQPTDPPPCADDSYTCDPANAFVGRALCKCLYRWDIDPADIPACGEYVESVVLFCDSVNYRPDDGGHIPTFPGTGCPHQVRDTCVWWMQATVVRTHVLTNSLQVHCDQIGPDDTQTCYDLVQSCEDCTFSNGSPHTDGTAKVICCCGSCPLDWCIGNCDDMDNPGHTCENCPDTGLCCSGCSDEYQNGDCRDGLGNIISCGPVCGATNTCNTQNRVYTFGHFSCSSVGQIKGCNPVGCPPNPDNTGDFFLHMGQHPIYDVDGYFINFSDNCSGDYFQVSC